MNCVFLQARVGSKRLPGKVLMPITGKPVLQHIIERLEYSRLIDKIIVVTSINTENNAIESLCNGLEIPCFRGSEDDVLDRYRQAIKAFDIRDDDKIIRITADCPFCDPAILDYMLEHSENSDLTTNCVERTFPDGLDLEIFNAGLLNNEHFDEINFFEKEYEKAFMDNKNFIIHNVVYHKDLSHLRWTLDTKEDLEFITKVYEKLYKPGQIFLMEDILKCQDLL